jgi:hypothetical protein
MDDLGIIYLKKKGGDQAEDMPFIMRNYLGMA